MRMTCCKNNVGMLRDLTDSPGQLQSVHLRHLYIQKNNIRLQLGQLIKRLRRIGERTRYCEALMTADQHLQQIQRWNLVFQNYGSVHLSHSYD